jgi:hypothetical protein
MTIFAEDDAIIHFLKPSVLQIGSISRLIWDNVVGVINAVDQAHATMGAFIPLAEESLVLHVFVEIECPRHWGALQKIFAIKSEASFSKASNCLSSYIFLMTNGLAEILAEWKRALVAPALSVIGDRWCA